MSERFWRAVHRLADRLAQWASGKHCRAMAPRLDREYRAYLERTERSA